MSDQTLDQTARQIADQPTDSLPTSQESSTQSTQSTQSTESIKPQEMSIMDRMGEKIRIADITESLIGTDIVVCGWVESKRFYSKKLAFFDVYDCATSHLTPLQIVCGEQTICSGTIGGQSDNVENIERIHSGSSIIACGKIVAPGKKSTQKFEMKVEAIHLIGGVDDTENIPIYHHTKIPLDSLYLTHAHIEGYHQYKACVYKIREIVIRAMREYFVSQNFIEVSLPTLTKSECESGCQPGRVTSAPLAPLTQSAAQFPELMGCNTYLTVSAQLHLETQRHLGNTYTITRAMRFEPSQTKRHLIEFDMLEFEEWFIDSSYYISNRSEELIKYVLKCVLCNCNDQLKFLESYYRESETFGTDLSKEPLRTTLKRYLAEPFVRISHADVVTMIKQEKTHKFEKILDYGDDLGSEHEKYICSKFDVPVIVKKYPKAVKAFYMPVIEETEDESHGVEHVDSFDILVQGIELVGGSKRIHDESELVSRIKEIGLDQEPLEFYIDLRRKGTAPHGGMGLGIERLVMIATGAPGVKHCRPFPRFPGCGPSSVA